MARTIRTTNPLLVPHTIYKKQTGDYVEYISTSGKFDNEVVGFRFFNVSTRKVEIVEADSLSSYLEHMEQSAS